MCLYKNYYSGGVFMSSKNKKLLFGAAAIGLAAAVATAYLKKSKSVQNDLDGEDEFEDDFENTENEEDTFSKEDLEEAQATTEKRHYVPINLEEEDSEEESEEEEEEAAQEADSSDTASDSTKTPNNN